MEEDMKRNVLIITSAILGLFVVTWLCVKFINNDIIPEKIKENIIETKTVVKGTKEETIDINSKSYKIKFNATIESRKEIDEEKNEEYNIDYLKYNILINDKEINGLNLSMELDEQPDKVEINEYVKVLKGTDNKDYLVIKLITNSGYGTTDENLFIINDKSELLFKYLHQISSIFYKINGSESQKYIIGSNNCDEFKYIDTGESLCNDFDKLYSTYKINEDNIEILECVNPEEFDGRLIEKELTVNNNKVSVKNTSSMYEMDDAGLSGAGFICPSYKNLTK